MSGEQLVSELCDPQQYKVELNSKKYQIEVELLENTEKYVHVLVSVDDGGIPVSDLSLTETFILQKTLPTA